MNEAAPQFGGLPDLAAPISAIAQAAAGVAPLDWERLEIFADYTQADAPKVWGEITTAHGTESLAVSIETALAFADIWQAFPAAGQPEWQTGVVLVESDGHVSADFGYDDAADR